MMASKKPKKASSAKGQPDVSGSSGRVWLASLVAIVLVVLVWIFVDLYRARAQTIECDDGTRRTIDMRDFVTQYTAHSIELESRVGKNTFSGKLEPVALRELSDSLQMVSTFQKYVVAGYNACAITKEQYAKLGATYQALDGLAQQLVSISAREELSRGEEESLTNLVHEYVQAARTLREE